MNDQTAGRSGRQANLRQTIQELSKTSHDAAATVALDAFLTPVASRPPLGERKLQQVANRDIVRFEGKEVVTYAWGEGKTVLLSHGWSGRGTQLGAFVSPLVEAGYRVVTFDAPAHGASPGTQTNILEFATALHSVGEQYGPLHAVIGHSLGAASILLAVSKFGLSAKCFVLIGCFAAAHDLTESFGRQHNIPDAVATRMEQLMYEKFGGRLDWENLDVPEMARVCDTPILIIHDRDDPEIPYRHAGLIASACANYSLLSTTGLGHQKILRHDEVVSAVVFFVASFKNA